MTAFRRVTTSVVLMVDWVSERAQWFAEHDAYLNTEEWREKRRLVIQRCKGLCEGCRSVPVAHVHHLTYEHF